MLIELLFFNACISFLLGLIVSSLSHNFDWIIVTALVVTYILGKFANRNYDIKEQSTYLVAIALLFFVSTSALSISWYILERHNKYNDFMISISNDESNIVLDYCNDEMLKIAIEKGYRIEKDGDTIILNK